MFFGKPCIVQPCVYESDIWVMEETGYLLDKGNELSASVMSAELTNELSASVMSAELTKSRIQDDIPFQYSGTSFELPANLMICVYLFPNWNVIILTWWIPEVKLRLFKKKKIGKQFAQNFFGFVYLFTFLLTWEFKEELTV